MKITQTVSKIVVAKKGRQFKQALISMDTSDLQLGVMADLFWCNSLFIYQDENKDKDKNQSFRLFLYVLKQTCDERTNNPKLHNTKAFVRSR